MKKIFKTALVISLFLFGTNVFAYAPTDFVTSWDTTAPNENTSVDVYVPSASYTYNFDVDCGDNGTWDYTGMSSDFTCFFAAPAVDNKIVIRGDFPYFSPAINGSNTTDTLDLRSIDQWGDQKWENIQNSFNKSPGLSFNATDVPDFSEISDFSDVFRSAVNIQGDISNWDLSSATNLYGFFRQSTNFNANMNSWIIPESVTNTEAMFAYVTNFQSNIDSWDVSDLKVYKRMFSYAHDLSIDISSWELSSAVNLSAMFFGSKNFNASMSNWILPASVLSVADMFRGTVDFQSNINAWDVSSLKVYANMFAYTTDFDNDISSWEPSSAVNMNRMFYAAQNFNADMSNWVWPASITNPSEMFRSTANFQSDINSWDVSNQKVFSSMFGYANNFAGDISSWDLASATHMNRMFYSAQNFNADMSNWVIPSSVSTASEMFRSTGNFQSDINSWDMSNLKVFSSMFAYASNFSGDISSWDLNSATNLRRMFYSAQNFNADMSNWIIPSSVSSISEMFRSTVNFQSDINSWDVSSLKTMSYMFRYAQNFNSDISGWDTTSVTSLYGAFEYAVGFDQDLSSWNIESVSQLTHMFRGSNDLSQLNYEALLASWGNQNVSSGEAFNAGDAVYGNCAAVEGRQKLIDKGWIISGDSLSATPEICATPPVVTITAPTKLKNGDITDTTILIVDDSQVDAGDISIHASSTAGTANLVCNPVGVDGDTVSCTVDITSSGTLVVEALDDESANATANEPNYVIDLVDPQVPSVSVDVLTNGINDPIITFSSFDFVGIDYYEVDYISDNNIAGVSSTITTDLPAVSGLTLDLDEHELTHTVTVRAFDLAGNSSESTIKFPPIVSFTTPTVISNVTITDAAVTITSPQGNDLGNIILTANTTGASLGACTGNGGDVSSPYASPVTCILNNIADTGTLSVSAKDAVNGAEGLNNKSFIIDTVDPVLTITAPIKESNAAITTTTIKVTDDQVIDAADITIAAINTTGLFSVSNLVCTQTTTTEVNCTLQVDANSGTGDLEVTVTDRAGNEVIDTEDSYEIDTTPPVITFDEDIATTLATSEAFTVTITDANPNTLAYVYGYSDDNTCDIDDTYSELLTSGAEVEIMDDTNTDKYVCIQALDRFNNESYAVSLNPLNIDTTKPAINFTDNVGTGPVQSDTIVLTSSDAHEDTATYKYGLSDDNVCDGTDTYPETFTNGSDIIFDTETNNGKYVCAMATDTLGQTRYRRSTNVLNIDITLPVITIVQDTSATPVQSDEVEFKVEDINEKPSTYEYGFNATNTCTSTSTYGNAFTSEVSITFDTEADNDDYICIKAEDEAGNESYKSVTNILRVDITPPVITFVDDVATDGPASDNIQILVSDNILKNPVSHKYGLSDDNICDVTDAYDKPYTDGGSFTLAGESDNDKYICVVATDVAGNTSYKVSGTALNIKNRGSATTVDTVGMCRADAVHGNDYVTIFPTREFGGNEAYAKYQTCKQEGKGGVYCATAWVKEIGKTVYTGENSCNVETEKETEENKNACNYETLKRYKNKRGTNYASDYYADEAKNKTNKYYEYLQDLTEQGIINGRSIEIETTDAEATIERYAHLDELIKRSEAVKLYSIAREDEVKWGSCLGNYFPDVTENGWYHKYVENLRTRKIVQGYKDGLFRPSRNISYAETFKVAAVSLGYIAQADAEREVELSKKYDDEGELIESISWYKPYQTVLEQRNILTKEMQTADPHAKITRGAVMSIMSRGLMEQDGITLP